MMQTLLHSLLSDTAVMPAQDPVATLTRVGFLLGCLSLAYAWRLWVLKEQSAH